MPSALKDEIGKVVSSINLIMMKNGQNLPRVYQNVYGQTLTWAKPSAYDKLGNNYENEVRATGTASEQKQ